MSDATPDPTPLVLLHGVGQSPMAWQDVVVPLWGSRPILTPWVPGLKPTDRGALSLQDAAATLDTNLMIEGVRAVDICGVGLGAMVAAQLAADFPDRVRRLVLVAGMVRVPKSAVRMQAGLTRLVPAKRLAAGGVSKARLLSNLETMRTADVTQALPRISAATLVLVGSRDRANAAGSRALSQAVAGARLEVVEGAGPAVNQQAPTELARILTEFLDG